MKWLVTVISHTGYRISPNNRTGHRGRKRSLNLVWFQRNSHGGLVNTSTLGAENMIQIGSVVSEIWQVKVKCQGHVYSGRRVYLAKYGISIWIGDMTVIVGRQCTFTNPLCELTICVLGLSWWSLQRVWHCTLWDTPLTWDVGRETLPKQTNKSPTDGSLLTIP